MCNEGEGWGWGRVAVTSLTQVNQFCISTDEVGIGRRKEGLKSIFKDLEGLVYFRTRLRMNYLFNRGSEKKKSGLNLGGKYIRKSRKIDCFLCYGTVNRGSVVHSQNGRFRSLKIHL